MTVPIWLWVDLHRSRNWPWLHNVSTSGSLAKGEDYRETSNCVIKSVYDIGGMSLGILNRIMNDFFFTIPLVMIFYLLCIISKKDALNAC